MKPRLGSEVVIIVKNSVLAFFLILNMMHVHIMQFACASQETDQHQTHLGSRSSLSPLNYQESIVWDPESLYQNGKFTSDPTSSSTNPTGRQKRSATLASSNSGQHHNHNQQQQQQQLVDACQSKMEILTPYYATNSQGKLRTIVNSELMQQAIQVETCIRSPSSQVRCSAQQDCGCEQKYKWHRLLVLDPRDSGASKGLFMDWFLFPSNCVCRCKNSPTNSGNQFLRALGIKRKLESNQ